ncbi:hypothetical protein BMS3Abin17_00699 [archaeon BMS3Abin17]|nr:hypothetical protein BMS3Abin17_00699 [archaeon BMS3Abin17]
MRDYKLYLKDILTAINMKKSIKIIISLSIFLSILISLLPLTTPVGEVSSCCEKTISGAWCQNSEESNCDDEYRSTPTSCEATSFCKLGVCYDSNEGTCMENTPEKICEEEGGVWEDSELDEVEQCILGCCLVGDQAAFVTQTRCTKLSSLYGLETNFRTDITNEMECIASAEPDVMGACVYEEEFTNTCKFITKKECQDIEDAEFHEDYLCSDESLGTICGPSEKTTCVEGEDQVYFLDTCGNLANIYDADKIEDDSYWSKVVSIADSCGYGSGNADSATCGNCDYFLGSTCKKYKSSEDKVKPNYGDNICRDLSCEYEGQTYEHGETWCAAAEGIKVITSSTQSDSPLRYNVPGSRYTRLVCYDNEVMVESCADYRAEICYQSDVNGFKASSCIVNMWHDCYGVTKQEDCENTAQRDCEWVSKYCILKDGEGECLAEAGACIPRFAPGFDFWNTEGDAATTCSYANTECVVTYKNGECEENCDCLGGSWAQAQNSFCSSLGDCGSSVNYINKKGYNDIDVIIKSAEEEGGV